MITAKLVAVAILVRRSSHCRQKAVRMTMRFTSGLPTA
jgi:hypothetical protein